MSMKRVLLLIFSILLAISHASEDKATTSLRLTPPSQNIISHVKQLPILPKEKSLDSMILSVQEGFNNGFNPVPVGKGITNPYFLKDKENKTIAVFKPMRHYFDGIENEVAVYLLDQKNGDDFAGIPPTTFVEISHPYFSEEVSKIDKEKLYSNFPVQNFTRPTGDNADINIIYGSLQKFVPDTEEAWKVDSSLFPDDEARKIAIFDLQVLNDDRHGGNILVKKQKGNLELVPIDHGFTLLFYLHNLKAVWSHWSQIKKDWAPKELSYISKINPVQDGEMLSKYFKFNDETLRMLRITETVLKKCALAGVILKDIADMYKHLRKGSQVWNLVFEAEKLTKNNSIPAHKNELFFEKFEELLDKQIETNVKTKEMTRNDQ